MMMAEIYKAAWMWSPVYVLAQTTKRASTQHGDWHVCRVNALVCVCSCTSQGSTLPPNACERRISCVSRTSTFNFQGEQLVENFATYVYTNKYVIYVRAAWSRAENRMPLANWSAFYYNNIDAGFDEPLVTFLLSLVRFHRFWGDPMLLKLLRYIVVCFLAISYSS